MMKEVEGDILLSNADAIAHGIAVDDDFKSGLALKLREQWPALYKDFRHFCKTHSPKEGDVWAWKGPGGPVIFNLFTQAAPEHDGGRPGRASLSNVNHALKNLAKVLNEQNIKSVAVTKLATGVGGLSWNDVKPVLDKDLGGYGGKVYVYSHYKPDQKAKEDESQCCGGGCH